MAKTLGDREHWDVRALSKSLVLIPFSFTTDGSGDVATEELPPHVTLAKTGTGEYTLTYPAAFKVYSAPTVTSTGIEIEPDYSTAGSLVLTTDSPAANLASASVNGCIYATWSKVG